MKSRNWLWLIGYVQGAFASHLPFQAFICVTAVTAGLVIAWSFQRVPS